MKEMVDANMDAVTAPSSVSVPRKVKASKPTSSRKRVEAVQGKSVNKKRQGLEACSKNSNKRSDLKDFSSRCEHTTNQGGMSHCCSENHPSVDLHDGNRLEEASKSLLLSSHDPVTADPHDLDENQLITVIQDGQEPDQKRRKIRLKKPTKTSTVCEQETYDELEAKIRDLKKETTMYSSKLKLFAEACCHLKEENDLLMDELKLWGTPEMMVDPERSNPDRSQQYREISEA